MPSEASPLLLGSNNNNSYNARFGYPKQSSEMGSPTEPAAAAREVVITDDAGTTKPADSIALDEAIQHEHNLTFLEACKLYPAAIGWSAFVSLGVIMLAFDPQLLGNLYATPQFQKDFGYLFEGDVCFLLNEWVVENLAYIFFFDGSTSSAPPGRRVCQWETPSAR